MIVKYAWRYLIETVTWLGLNRLAKVYFGGTLRRQFTVRVVQAPVHTFIFRPLLRLRISRSLIPRKLVLKRYLLILKRLFQFGNVLLVFQIYLPLLDPLRSLFVFDCFGFHRSFLLIEVELHLL